MLVSFILSPVTVIAVFSAK